MALIAVSVSHRGEGEAPAGLTSISRSAGRLPGVRVCELTPAPTRAA